MSIDHVELNLCVSTGIMLISLVCLRPAYGRARVKRETFRNRSLVQAYCSSGPWLWKVSGQLERFHFIEHRQTDECSLPAARRVPLMARR